MADSKKYASVRNSLVRELLEISDYVDTVGDISHSSNRDIMATIKSRYKRLSEIESEFFVAQNKVMLFVYSREERKTQEQFHAKFVNVYNDAKAKYNDIISRSIIIDNFSMPKFDGRRENWTKFKTESRKMLEDYISDNTKRLRFMKEAVSGKAAELLCPLAEKGENYLLAWDILRSYYDKIDVPSDANTSARDLKQYLNQDSANAQNPPGIKTSYYNPTAGSLGIGRSSDEVNSRSHSLSNRPIPSLMDIKMTAVSQPTSHGQNMPNIPPSSNQYSPAPLNRNMSNISPSSNQYSPAPLNRNMSNIPPSSNQCQPAFLNRNMSNIPPSSNQCQPAFLNRNMSNIPPSSNQCQPASLNRNMPNIPSSSNQCQPAFLNRNMPNIPPLCNQFQPTIISGNTPNPQSYVANGAPNQFGQPSFIQRSPNVVNRYPNQVPNNYTGSPGVPQANQMARMPNDYFIRSGAPLVNNAQSPNNFVYNPRMPRMNVGQVQNSFNVPRVVPRFTISPMPNNSCIAPGMRQGNAGHVSNTSAGMSQVPLSNQFGIRCGSNQVIVGPSNLPSTPNGVADNRPSLQMRTSGPINYQSPNAVARPPVFNQMVNNQQRMPGNYFGCSRLPPAALALQQMSDCGQQSSTALQSVSTDGTCNKSLKSVIKPESPKSTYPKKSGNVSSSTKVNGDDSATPANSKNMGDVIALDSDSDCEVLEVPQCQKFDENKMAWTEFKKKIIGDSIKGARDDREKLTSLRKTIPEDKHLIFAKAESYSQAISLLDYYYEFSNPLRSTLNQLKSFPKIPQHRTAGHLESFIRRARGTMNALKAFQKCRTNVNLFDGLIIDHVSNKFQKFDAVWEVEKDQTCTFPDFEVFRHCIVGKCEEDRVNGIQYGEEKVEMSSISEVFGKKKIDEDFEKNSAKKRKTESLLHVEESSEKSAMGGDDDKCVICGDLHEIKSCSKFLDMSWWGRMQAKDVLKICSHCVRVGCDTKTCKNKSNCLRCGFPHHTLFHPSSFSARKNQ